MSRNYCEELNCNRCCGNVQIYHIKPRELIATWPDVKVVDSFETYSTASTVAIEVRGWLSHEYIVWIKNICPNWNHGCMKENDKPETCRRFKFMGPECPQSKMFL